MLSFRVSVPFIFAALLACALPFSNISKLNGIEDGLSPIIYFLLLLLFIIFEIKRAGLNINFRPEICIIFVSFLIGLTGLNLDRISGYSTIFYLSKFLILISIETVATRHPIVFSYFLKYYYAIFLFSLKVSVLLWALNPLPEFVFYDGSERRFGGLHFELFNFCFSLFIAMYSWRYNGGNKFVGFVVLITLGLVSGSNFFLIYLLIFFLPNSALTIFRYRLLSCIIVIIIFLLPAFIGLFLSKLDFLVNFGLRRQSDFSLDGSAIYVRFYPYYLAVEHLIDLGWYSLFPSGLGSFENSNLIMNNPFSYGGTGSPKAMVDVGIALFVLLAIFVGTRVSFAFTRWGYYKYDILKLIIACLFFISFGAGFFNIVAWSVIIMSTEWSGEVND